MAAGERGRDAGRRRPGDRAGAAADACLFGGNGERGRELVTAALAEIDAGTEPMRVVEALERRSRIEHRISGGGGADVEAALRLLPDDPDLPARGRLLGHQAHIELLAGDYENTLLLGREIWRIAEQADDRELRYRARIVLSIAVAASGDYDEALGMLVEARELAQGYRNPDQSLTTVLYEGAVLTMFAGRYERAAEILRTAIVQARSVGMASMRATMLAANLAVCLFAIGEWEELAELLADALSWAPPPLYRCSLTPRELEVLRLVAAGRSNRQIAAELFISANTAGVHVSRILTKLGVTTRTEAAALAHRQNLFGG